MANSGSSTVSAIKGVKVAGTWTVGGTLGGITVDSALNQVYVADTSGTHIVILNGSTGSVLKSISTTAKPGAMAVNIATRALFVACSASSDSVVVIDGNAKQVTTTINNLPAGTTSLLVDPATNVAVLVTPVSGIYTVIDAAHGYSITQENGEAGAKGIATAFDPGGPGSFFLADSGAATFSSAVATELSLSATLTLRDCKRGRPGHQSGD